MKSDAQRMWRDFFNVEHELGRRAAQELCLYGEPDYARCSKCDAIVGPGPDPCFGGLLPGVRFACCGHGGSAGYVYFTNGTIIRFGYCTVDPALGEHDWAGFTEWYSDLTIDGDDYWDDWVAEARAR